ncbi:hypothetical protein CWB89_21120 [Pseudoalteromonas piscicida]|uniref:Uncharacterized protein n=1 Tax=Pseudoalteromonas piscicida TaxID=43662 RepID=A0AAQ2IR68_PSEO7|nr:MULTISPECIES: hypothetical protein [Pseudoalteromonas]KJY88679.1 hypothetical protein TW75_11750 [Pseudoalteromonas piscicida]TMN35216.1 hypothetical protein CWB94_21010 [Pseudoalteromonas piscicida]TMN42247.1 hypothetical protein CWB95_07725 [Pseudoalteromonas piscicida]TMN48831.1 hypothetical protein CWB91_18140 [Pseudoalteromonas piscicida]TMN54140.1 hypothetical protein CWB93_13525 [Pseudoalteromonas piscicida]
MSTSGDRSKPYMIINIALDWLAKLSVIASAVFVAVAYKQVYDVEMQLEEKSTKVANLEKEKLGLEEQKLNLEDAKLSLEKEKLNLTENIELMREKEKAVLSRVKKLAQRETQLKSSNELLAAQNELYEALSVNMSLTRKELKKNKDYHIDLASYIEEFSFSFMSQTVISYIAKMLIVEKLFAKADGREFNYKKQLRKHLEIVSADKDKLLPTKAYKRMSEIALSTNNTDELMGKLGNTWVSHHNKTLNEISVDALFEDISNNESNLDKLQTKNDEIMNALNELKSRL